jgi:hypothetical protein
MPDEIFHHDVLYRRIFLNHIVTRENNRISSAAFKKGKKPDPDCSVYVERLMSDSTEPMWTAVGGQVLIQLSASEPIDRGILVKHDPISVDPQHPHIPAQTGHAIMVIETKVQCDELASVSSLVSRTSRYYGES